MRAILRESNLDLLGEVERLIAALKVTPVVPELAPYHDHVVRACADLREQVCHNLRDLELGLRPHPVTWLRARLLARRARELGCETAANTMERQWATIAATLGVAEDYYGFYEEEFLPAILQTLDDMVMEAEPYRFTPRDLGEKEWTFDSTPVHLLNRAWRQFRSNPDEYPAWEHQSIATFCALP